MRHLRQSVRIAVWEAVPLWLASRVVVALVSFTTLWALNPGDAAGLPSFWSIWFRWDVELFGKVARYGYFSPGPPTNTQVMFPGTPLLVRLVHVVVRDWAAAAVVVSLLASTAAAVALYRLAGDELGPRAGRKAVLYLACFPYAVFLFAGYSEPVFLAFALWSWVCAKQAKWDLSLLLCAAAVLSRITGVFLAVALFVEYVRTRRLATRSRGPLLSWPALQALPSRHVAGFLAPVAALTGYVVFLHERSGHWDEYQRAQKAGWGRALAFPLDGLRTTWNQARNYRQASAYLWSWRAEIASVLVVLALAVVLFWQRHWAEATFTGLSGVFLASQNYYQSAARGLLVTFPLYLVLVRLSERREWVGWFYLLACGPLMLGFVVAFTRGAWVG